MIGKDVFSETISECVLRWPQLGKQMDVYYSRLSFMPYEAFYDICNRFVDTYKFVPLPKDFKEAYFEWKSDNFTKDPDAIERDEFKIFHNVHCRTCGDRDVTCIQYPVGSDNMCMQCYTGLTGEHITQRFKDLIRMIKDKHFKPDWVKDLDAPF